MSYYIMEIIFIIVGIISVFTGLTKHKFWIEKVPGGGFMPVVIGTLLIILSALIVLKKDQKAKVKLSKKELIPIIAMVILLILTKVIGLLPSLLIIVLGMLRFVENYSWKNSIIISVVLMSIIYAIFSLWLKVPFPRGIIG